MRPDLAKLPGGAEASTAAASGAVQQSEDVHSEASSPL